MDNHISEKVTDYLKLYRIDTVLLSSLTQQVMQQVNVRLTQEQCESPLEIAIEEAQKVVDTWLATKNHLPATIEQVLSARLRQTLSNSVDTEISYVNVPPLAELEMPPQKIEFWSLWQGSKSLLRCFFNKLTESFAFMLSIFRGHL